MEKQLYSIFDSKSGIYAAPFVETNKGSAIRAINELIARGDSTPAKYPEDFQLVHLGSYDEQSGQIVPQEGAIIVIGLNEIGE